MQNPQHLVIFGENTILFQFFFFCSKFSILFYPYTGHISQWVGTRWERVCILKESRVLTGGGHK